MNVLQRTSQAFAVVFVLHAAATLLSACHLLDPYEDAQTLEQRAGVVLGDFEIYQQASIDIGKNADVPAEVRLKVVQAARTAKSYIDDLDKALRVYQGLKEAVEGGEDPGDRLRSAEADLEHWVKRTKPQVDGLKTEVGRARP